MRNSTPLFGFAYRIPEIDNRYRLGNRRSPPMQRFGGSDFLLCNAACAETVRSDSAERDNRFGRCPRQREPRCLVAQAG